MEITVEEMRRLSPEDYILIDMRNEQTRDYGVIPGALPVSQEELESNPPETDGRKLILYCAHGQFSLDAAEALREKGIDAYSLRGGYIEWLRDQMERQQADELCQRVENSLRKKFREKLWCNFTKAVRDYELVKSGDRIAVCISGGKDSMLMAKLFQELRAHGRQNFGVVFLVMNPGYNQVNHQAVLENPKLLGIPIEVFHTEIFDFVAKQGGSPC